MKGTGVDGALAEGQDISGGKGGRVCAAEVAAPPPQSGCFCLSRPACPGLCSGLRAWPLWHAIQRALVVSSSWNDVFFKRLADWLTRS